MSFSSPPKDSEQDPANLLQHQRSHLDILLSEDLDEDMDVQHGPSQDNKEESQLNDLNILIDDSIRDTSKADDIVMHPEMQSQTRRVQELIVGTAQLCVQQSQNRENGMVDTFNIENWNFESAQSLREFSIQDDDKLLNLLFHHGMPGGLIKTFEKFDGKGVSKLAEVALDHLKIKVVTRNNETDALCTWIFLNRSFASLLVLDFPETNGALIFQKLASMSHLTDQILRQVYKLTQNQINVLKNSRINNASTSSSNDFKATSFYQTRITALKRQILPHLPLLDSLFLQAQNSSFASLAISEESHCYGPEDFLSALASSFQSYKHRVKGKSQRQSETVTAEQQRKSNLDLHYQHFVKEMQVDDEESVHSDYILEHNNRQHSSNHRKHAGSPESSSSQAQEEGGHLLRGAKRLQIRDYFPRSKNKMRRPDGLVKRRREESGERKKPINIVPRAKRDEEYGGRVKRESKSTKGQWGKIVDYFSQETSSTSISGQRHGSSENRSQGHIIGKNLLKTSHAAPSLDSLFYKKHGMQKETCQTALKDSAFKKRVFGQVQCEDQELYKKIINFDLRLSLEKFKHDKYFKAHLSQHLTRIQNLMGKTQISCPEGDVSFIFESQKYQLNDLASIVKSFRAYKEAIQQFSLYASNNKIDKINMTFNVFWFLITNALQNTFDLQARSEVNVRVREEFLYLMNQLNIVDFMSIKSFEYQANVVLHIIMIVNLIQQEGGGGGDGQDQDEIIKILQYLMQWIIMTLQSLSLNSQQNLESARNLMKKELSDCFLLIHLIHKAFSQDKVAWLALQKDSLSRVYQNSISATSTLQTGGVTDHKLKLTFSDWKLKPQPFLTFDPKSSLTPLDLTLYTYTLLLLAQEYNIAALLAHPGPSITVPPDWPFLSELLQDHLSRQLQPSAPTAPLSQLTLKLLSALMVHGATAAAAQQQDQQHLSHEDFMIIYRQYLRVPKQPQQVMTLKQQREILTQVTDSMLRRYGGKMTSCPEAAPTGLLDSYVRTQDQRQVKQLYQKVSAMPEVEADDRVKFGVQMAFVGAIESERQAMMVMKKAMGVAQKEATKEDWYEVAKMVIAIAGMSNKFKGQGDDSIDKSEIIMTVLGLVKKMVAFFIAKVLKNKGNLNQNEYMIKTETYLLQLSSVFKALADFAQPLKGTWRQHEYRWLSDPQQLTDDIFSIYSYLAVKTLDLESLQFDYLRLLKTFLSARRSSINKEPQPPTLTLDHTSMSSSLEGADDIIAECLIYEEQDQLMVKELTKSNLRHILERVMKGYMTAGKDIRVLIKLFQISGLIDGVLLESGEMKPIQVLQKVQASKYGLVNDSIDNIQKQMITSVCINSYAQKVISRSGISRICGPEALSQCKNDNTQKDLIVQISYNVLENLIRGLLVYQRSAQSQATASKIFCKSLKLYRDLRAYAHCQDYQTQSFLIFKDQLNENRVLLAFTATSIGASETQTNLTTYDLIVEIFSRFFKEAVRMYDAAEINKQVFANTINMYVALIPMLCKQFQELSPQNKGDFKPYLDFLKQIMLSYMVTVQHLSQQHHNIAQFISQIINLVMPSFFGENTKQLASTSLDSLDSHDAFYFYQFLQLQSTQNPDDPRIRSNQRHFLDLSLRTLESHLNTLIPNLLLNNQDMSEADQHLAITNCPVLKPLLDSIASSSIADNDSFLHNLLTQSLQHLQTPVRTSPWSASDHQLVLKSQRRVLCLLILCMMLGVRLKNKKVVKKVLLKVCQLLIREWAESADAAIGWENNLNVLAMLKVARVIGEKQILGRYIVKIMEVIVREERRKFGMDERICERRQVLRWKVEEKMREGRDSSTCWFLVKSAHQFILSDQNLISNLIVSISLDLLSEIKLNRDSVVLLRLIPRDPISQSKLHYQVISRLESIIMIQDESMSTIKCPEKFKSLNQLLL